MRISSGMRVSAVGRFVSRLILAVAVAACGYLLIYRPMQLRWGATPEEVARLMPGDDLQPQPILNATRAVTIEARPAEIWPWLTQIGYRRAGWYGYDWVDNDGIASADRILPELQGLTVGDAIPIWRGISFPVRLLEANRSLVFASDDGKNSMALELIPAGPERTRLLWRVRLAPYDWKSGLLLTQVLTDMADFIAVRQNLLGIKARAEGKKRESTVKMHGTLGLWMISFLLFVAAEAGVVVGRDLWSALLAAMATGLIAAFVVMGNLSIWVDLAGVLLGVICLRLAFHRGNGERTSAIASGSPYRKERG